MKNVWNWETTSFASVLQLGIPEVSAKAVTLHVQTEGLKYQLFTDISVYNHCERTSKSSPYDVYVERKI